MSKPLPSRAQALQLLYDSGCSNAITNHCRAVAELAVEMAKACQKRGLNVDLELVRIGAFLHDIGRSKIHTVHHAIVGAEMLSSMDLPEPVISIVKRHVGGGITAREAKKLGWPKDTYTPNSLEEKIVSYADKLIEGCRRVSIEHSLKKFSEELPPSAVERVRRLHEEIAILVGSFKCQK